ncbi:MAG TPA: hypothetical protein VMB84_11720, partial [Stellaceae bacterium]|nr:hypothetical protein [Stellaceae bacterium]
MFKMPARLLARRRQQRREVFNDTDARALAPAPDETINVEVPLRVNAELGARLLRQNKTLIVRNALDPAMVRAYGRAVKEHWSAYMN